MKYEFIDILVLIIFQVLPIMVGVVLILDKIDKIGNVERMKYTYRRPNSDSEFTDPYVEAFNGEPNPDKRINTIRG